MIAFIKDGVGPDFPIAFVKVKDEDVTKNFEIFFEDELLHSKTRGDDYPLKPETLAKLLDKIKPPKTESPKNRAEWRCPPSAVTSLQGLESTPMLQSKLTERSFVHKEGLRRFLAAHGVCEEDQKAILKLAAP